VLGRAEELLGRAYDVLGRAEELLGKAYDMLGRAEELLGRGYDVLGSSAALPVCFSLRSLTSEQNLLMSARELISIAPS